MDTVDPSVPTDPDVDLGPNLFEEKPRARKKGSKIIEDGKGGFSGDDLGPAPSDDLPDPETPPSVQAVVQEYRAAWAAQSETAQTPEVVTSVEDAVTALTAVLQDLRQALDEVTRRVDDDALRCEEFETMRTTLHGLIDTMRHQTLAEQAEHLALTQVACQHTLEKCEQTLQSQVVHISESWEATLRTMAQQHSSIHALRDTLQDFRPIVPFSTSIRVLSPSGYRMTVTIQEVSQEAFIAAFASMMQFLKENGFAAEPRKDLAYEGA